MGAQAGRSLEAMLADDLDAALSALEDAAPVTPEAREQPDVRVDDAKAVEPDNPEAADPSAPTEEWKPPTKEHFENLEKARRADREALREARRQQVIFEQNLQRMQARQEQFLREQQFRQMQQQAPDPYENPEAARAWQAQQQELQQRMFLAEQQRQQQIMQRQEQDRQFQFVNQTVEDIEAEFKAQAPDYDDATEHLLSTQQKLLEGMGYPPQVAAEQVGMWSLSVATQAIQTGKNPAAVAYELAKQMGYRPKGSEAETAAQKLANMKAGQDSAKTLSGGGAGVKGGTSLKQIASLEGAAFDSAMDKWLSDSIRGR